MNTRLAALSLILVLVGAERLTAEGQVPRSLRDVGFDQNLNAQIPLDLEFVDENGQSVHLREYFKGRPVILVLAYFRCPMLCDRVLNGLVQSMLDMPLQIGQDYEVITVSFDPRETPAMARAKKKRYLERLGRPAARDSWHFLTGKAGAIKKLTRKAGFRYHYDARHDQFAHASGIIVLTPNGKISRYFFDVHYDPGDLRLGLVEASNNEIGSTIDQILLFCFHYDPTTGKYGVAIMNFVRLGGVLTIVVVAGMMFVLWRREWKRDKPTEPQQVTPSE